MLFLYFIQRIRLKMPDLFLYAELKTKYYA